MHSAIIFALVAMAAARPDYSANQRSDSVEVPIIRDARVFPSADGQFSTDTETGDDIFITQSGAGTGPDGAVEKEGTVKFTLPDGQDFELRYVADAEGGYQPESSFLPVAPEFPHPIPQFVLDQIAKAAEEDKLAARSNDDSDEDRYSYN